AHFRCESKALPCVAFRSARRRDRTGTSHRGVHRNIGSQAEEGPFMTISAISPVTGDVVSTHEEMTAAAVERIVDDVHRTFVEWRGTSFAARAALLRKDGQLLRAEGDEFARRMAREMGKPGRDGVAETQK